MMAPFILLGLVAAGAAFAIFEHQHGRTVKDALKSTWDALRHVQAAEEAPTADELDQHAELAADAHVEAAQKTQQAVATAKTDRERAVAAALDAYTRAIARVLELKATLARERGTAPGVAVASTLAHELQNVTEAMTQLMRLGVKIPDPPKPKRLMDPKVKARWLEIVKRKGEAARAMEKSPAVAMDDGKGGPVA